MSNIQVPFMVRFVTAIGKGRHSGPGTNVREMVKINYLTLVAYLMIFIGNWQNQATTRHIENEKPVG